MIKIMLSINRTGERASISMRNVPDTMRAYALMRIVEKTTFGCHIFIDDSDNRLVYVAQLVEFFRQDILNKIIVYDQLIISVGQVHRNFIDTFHRGVTNEQRGDRTTERTDQAGQEDSPTSEIPVDVRTGRESRLEPDPNEPF